MRKYALVASATVASEEFLGMSHAAQALYLQILCETETSGEVVNIARVVRAAGFGSDALNELFDCGYLLAVGEWVVVRHQWQNNRLTEKAWRSMDSFEPYQTGLLEFEGVEGKSPYRLAEVTPDPHPSDTQGAPNDNRDGTEVNSNSNGKPNGTGTSTFNDNGNLTQRQMQGEWESEGKGEDSPTLHDCQCAKCHGVATYWQAGGQTFIRCPSCGEYEYKR